MNTWPIIFSGPSITNREIECATSAAAVGWNRNHAGYIKAFEAEMVKTVGQKYCIGLSSGSNALHLAFMSLGLGAGDEVLVPEIAHISVAAGIAHTGATPVFCDVEPETLCIAAADAASKVTKNTKGIVAVHMHGHPCNMAEIMKLAVMHKLFVLEDISLALGSTYRGRPIGSFGSVSVASFSHDNTQTCGEGGALLTSNKQIFKNALKLANNGIANDNPFISESLGYNYAISNLQASCALAQVERLQELLNKKKQIFFWYKKHLQDVPGIRLNFQHAEVENSYSSTILFLEDPALVRNEFMQGLAQCGIATRPVFYPLSYMPMFKRCNNPVAYSVGARAILLPSGHNRTEEEVAYVAGVIKALLKNDKQGASNVSPTGWMKYKDEVLAILNAAKTEGLTLPFTHDGTSYSLKAMREDDVDNPDIINLLTKWRQENSEIYLSRFYITAETVKSLLAGYRTQNKDYILFFVTKGDEIIGHIGLDNFAFQKNECVVESLIMQQPVPRGLAAAAGEALYSWAKQELKIKKIFNHVVGTNLKVRLLAAAQGFKELYKVPLYKRTVPGGIVFHPMYMPGHDTPDEFFVVSAREL